jgi:UDP-N-acetyl-D-galactosamine dehydrogenase
LDKHLQLAAIFRQQLPFLTADNMSETSNQRIVVIGLGYVGLPLAVALAKSFDVTGFDIDQRRVTELRQGHDRTHEVEQAALGLSSLKLTHEASECGGADVYIVTVPTPVDADNRPDLRPVISATESVARMIDGSKRPIIVYESTVYPGVTDDICGPLLERISGLKRGEDFFLGYSPERINPGDRRSKRVERIVKVVAGENEEVTGAAGRPLRKGDQRRRVPSPLDQGGRGPPR